jgi:superfamily II DNA or RNA helicase
MTPRPEQKPALDFLADFTKERGQLQGILQAAPGVGKTVMSIKTAHDLRTRTIIVVPNEVLQDQWLDAITQFTNLTQDDIAIIQGSDLPKIEIELGDKPIAIVKIQSLYSQIKNNKLVDIMNLYRFIDLVIYDEAHTSAGATGYAKTSSLFQTGNYLGLTATPYRVDLNYYMLRSAIGEVIHKIEFSNEVPEVEIHKIYTEFYPKEISKLKNMLTEYTMFLGVFNALMKTKEPYFEYLADVVAWNYSNGHNIVILFPTIALMEKLQQYISQRHPDIFHKVLLLKGKTKQDAIDLVKGERQKIMAEYKIYKESLDTRVKAKEIKRKEATEMARERRKEIDAKIDYLKEHALDIYKRKVQESEIIISNYNLLSAGFDKATLSNIIFGAAPRVGKISVIQSIGRVTRKCEGKKKPLVQYFIPSTFIDFQGSTGVILNRNIKVQYPDAQFKYIGFNDG